MLHTVHLNGLRYSVEERGEGAEAVLLLHGFTGCAANWATITPRLAERYRVIAPDLIGHGDTESPADPERYRVEQAAEDLIALLDVLGLDAVHWVGYSMGARLALHTALHHPQRVATLTLESGSPGLASAEEREVRVANDTALAMRIEHDGLEAFVAYWEALPLFATQQSMPEAVRRHLQAARLRNDPRGLANSLRGMGSGAQPSGWNDLAALERPTHLIVGALDPKFMGIAGQMLARLPDARCTVVPQAGHTVHLERPEVFVEAVLSGLIAGHPPSPSTETRTG